MHEVSICRDLLNLPFSNIEEPALRFSFDALTKGGLVDGADLVVEHTKGEGICEQCGHHQSLKERFESCGNCGEFPIALVRGDEMRLKSLEVY